MNKKVVTAMLTSTVITSSCSDQNLSKQQHLAKQIEQRLQIQDIPLTHLHFEKKLTKGKVEYIISVDKDHEDIDLCIQKKDREHDRSYLLEDKHSDGSLDHGEVTYLSKDKELHPGITEKIEPNRVHLEGYIQFDPKIHVESEQKDVLHNTEKDEFFSAVHDQTLAEVYEVLTSPGKKK